MDHLLVPAYFSPMKNLIRFIVIFDIKTSFPTGTTNTEKFNNSAASLIKFRWPYYIGRKRGLGVEYNNKINLEFTGDVL